MIRTPSPRCRRCRAALDPGAAPHAVHGFPAIVCSSCGATEPVHLYPRPSGTAERWAFVGAIGWLLAWIGVVGFTLFMCTALTIVVTYEGVDRSERLVREAFHAWYRAEHPDFPGSIPWWETWEFRRWWAAEGPEAVAAIKAGGGVLEWTEMLPLAFVLAASAAVAALVAVAMPHRRPWSMTLAALPVVALLPAGSAIVWAILRALPMSSCDMVMTRCWVMPVLTVNLTILCASFVAGFWAGRPCARGIVRALLPPRRRPPLAWLWTADGLAAPAREGVPR